MAGDGKIFVSWKGVEMAVSSLSKSIRRLEDPDLIIGIARGGLPGAVTMSHTLGVDMHAVHASHYQSDQLLSSVRVREPNLPEVDDGASLLIFDDVADTGETFKVIEEKLNKEWYAETPVKTSTASIHIKPGCEYVPDYWVDKVEEWVVYPWEGTIDV